MTTDERFMLEAIKEAEIAAAEGNCPMGCVIVLDGDVIAHSPNTGYTDKNRMAHAEVKALTDAKEKLKAKEEKQCSTLLMNHTQCASVLS